MVINSSHYNKADMAKLDSAQYFSSYVDADIHRLMVSDVVRTETYREAILQNAHLFKDKTAMDVGAGTGILSLFMVQAGAKKVHAVEASDMATVIQDVVKENGLETVIEVHHCPLEEVLIEEKVDVIVSECMGFFLLHECMFDTFLTARDRFLADDGYIFPSEARLYACPCTLQEMFSTEIDYWVDVYGFNMEAVKRFSLRSKSKKPEVRIVNPSELLADPVCFKTFDLRYVTKEELQDFEEVSFVRISKDGNYRGLCIWFECDFDGRQYFGNGEETGGAFSLSTSPFAAATHWKQTVICFGLKDDEGCGKGKTVTYTVEENEVVGWKLHFVQAEESKRHYIIDFEMLDPDTEEHPIPCLCPMAKCRIIKAMLDKEDCQEAEDMEEDANVS